MKLSSARDGFTGIPAPGRSMTNWLPVPFISPSWLTPDFVLVRFTMPYCVISMPCVCEYVSGSMRAAMPRSMRGNQPGLFFASKDGVGIYAVVIFPSVIEN